MGPKPLKRFGRSQEGAKFTRLKPGENESRGENWQRALCVLNAFVVNFFQNKKLEPAT